MRALLIAASTFVAATAFFALGPSDANAACKKDIECSKPLPKTASAEERKLFKNRCATVIADITIGCNKRIKVRGTVHTVVNNNRAYVQQIGQPEGCLLAMQARPTNSNDKLNGKKITTAWFVKAASGVLRENGDFVEINKNNSFFTILGHEAFPGACEGSIYRTAVALPR